MCMHTCGMPPATPLVVVDSCCVPVKAGSAVGLTISYRRKVMPEFAFVPAWLILMQVACNTFSVLQTYLPLAFGVMTGTILDVLSGENSSSFPMAFVHGMLVHHASIGMGMFTVSSLTFRCRLLSMSGAVEGSQAAP